MTFTMPAEIVAMGSTLKKQFVRFQEGNPILIQFMEPDVTWARIHTIRTVDIPYLKIAHEGVDCPICAYPEFRDKYPLSARFRVNVLDITPEKTCPQCQSVFNALKHTPDFCSCGQSLQESPIAPRNIVRIMENGRRLFNSFNKIISMLVVSTSDFDVKAIPFIIMTSGKGTEMTKIVTPRTDLKITPLSDMFKPFDLSLGTFTKDEVLKMLQGTPTRDIWKMRRAEETPLSTPSQKLDFTSLPGLF